MVSFLGDYTETVNGLTVTLEGEASVGDCGLTLD
eukprot:COSAG05_NODE_17538_length_323_cov_1.156250_1_plen_33_part_01